MSTNVPSQDSDDRPTAPEAVLQSIRSLPRAGATPAPADQRADGQASTGRPATLFDRVGGEDFFVRLVDAFYSRVADDQVLRPLYPDADLAPANERFRLFLIQYWGGPSTYSQQRGHPRLRMRHAPFPVGSVQIEHWLAAMKAALEEVAPPPEIAEELWAYMDKSAHFMRNQAT